MLVEEVFALKLEPFSATSNGEANPNFLLKGGKAGGGTKWGFQED